MKKQSKANLTPKKVYRATELAVLDHTFIGVYKVCLGEYFYIGRSSNVIGRVAYHLKKLIKGDHDNKFMQDVYSKHSDFTFEVLHIVDSVEQSEELEQKLIEENINKPKCMNICPSASIPTRKGKTNSEAHNEAISRAQKDRVYSQENKDNMSEAQKKRFANGWSEDFRAKMMASRDTEEYREKLRQAQLGKTLSEEHKQKISDSLKGRVYSEESKKKMSEALKGREFSDEWRANLSKAQKGIKASEETKKKMRLAQQRRRERENAKKII